MYKGASFVFLQHTVTPEAIIRDGDRKRGFHASPCVVTKKLFLEKYAKISFTDQCQIFQHRSEVNFSITSFCRKAHCFLRRLLAYCFQEVLSVRLEINAHSFISC